jgi:hypothetical protein
VPPVKICHSVAKHLPYKQSHIIPYVKDEDLVTKKDLDEAAKLLKIDRNKPDPATNGPARP